MTVSTHVAAVSYQLQLPIRLVKGFKAVNDFDPFDYHDKKAKELFNLLLGRLERRVEGWIECYVWRSREGPPLIAYLATLDGHRDILEVRTNPLNLDGLAAVSSVLSEEDIRSAIKEAQNM